MPLLLAIEPDDRHAALIEEQARRLGAELIVTGSADAAIRALGQRVPDLVLTSLLLSPRDEGRLQDQLRQLDAAGAHVQTLVIPVMSEPSAEEAKPTGVLSRLRKRRSSTPAPDGCDPAVFGAQIAEYLKRAAKTRTKVNAPPAPVSPPEPVQLPDSVVVQEPVVAPEPVLVQESAFDPESVLLREYVLIPDPVVEAVPDTADPVVVAAAVPVTATEVDVFLATDRLWKPRRPLVIEHNEYDAPTLIAMLEPDARSRTGPDGAALSAVVRQSIDRMRSGQATARTA